MAQAELLQPLALPQPRWSRGVIAAAAMALSLAAGLSMGGQVGRFAATGLVYVPLILLAGLLQLRRWRTARVLSWIWFWFMVVAVALTALGMVLATLAPTGMLGQAAVVGRHFDPTAQAQLKEVIGGLIAPALGVLGIVLAGIVLAATPLWPAVARILGARGIDQAHPAHAQGTVGLLVGTALAIAPLVLLGGRAPLVDLLNKIDPSSIGGMLEQLIDQSSSAVWTIVFALWASAWPVRLSFREALVRLGVTKLARHDALPLIAITVLLVALGFALDFLSRAIWGAFGWPSTDASVITRLISVAATPLGAVIIALCAGVSEELLFRGLLQPRFGWLLANIGFAAMHAFQYGPDGLVAVFIVGAVLAFVRERWTTSASIGVHVGYDLILLLLAQLGF
jgi:uncharacterized protein